MALLATLQIGDNNTQHFSHEYLVSDVKCHIMRHHNRHRPDSTAYCERLEITVVVPGKSDLTLIDWYVSQSSRSGRIVIELMNKGSKVSEMKEICFEEAVCFRLSEKYDIDKNRRRMLCLSFKAEKVTIDQVEFEEN